MGERLTTIRSRSRALADPLLHCCVLPNRRASDEVGGGHYKAVYKGCTRGAQGKYIGCTRFSPWYSPCAPLVLPLYTTLDPDRPPLAGAGRFPGALGAAVTWTIVRQDCHPWPNRCVGARVVLDRRLWVFAAVLVRALTIKSLHHGLGAANRVVAMGCCCPIRPWSPAKANDKGQTFRMTRKSPPQEAARANSCF